MTSEKKCAGVRGVEDRYYGGCSTVFVSGPCS